MNLIKGDVFHVGYVNIAYYASEVDKQHRTVTAKELNTGKVVVFSFETLRHLDYRRLYSCMPSDACRPKRLNRRLLLIP